MALKDIHRPDFSEVRLQHTVGLQVVHNNTGVIKQTTISWYEVTAYGGIDAVPCQNSSQFRILPIASYRVYNQGVSWCLMVVLLCIIIESIQVISPNRLPGSIASPLPPVRSALVQPPLTGAATTISRCPDTTIATERQQGQEGTREKLPPNCCENYAPPAGVRIVIS